MMGEGGAILDLSSFEQETMKIKQEFVVSTNQNFGSLFTSLVL